VPARSPIYSHVYAEWDQLTHRVYTEETYNSWGVLGCGHVFTSTSGDVRVPVGHTRLGRYVMPLMFPVNCLGCLRGD
jgi:hypothetical protein